MDNNGTIVEGATGYDGYLKMSSPSPHEDYTKMSPAPPPPQDIFNFDEEDENESPRYMNQKDWKKEKAEQFELQPMMSNEIGNEASKADSPVRLRTEAVIHRNEDTDSGHSSTYALGTSPDNVDDSGYLVPNSKNLHSPLFQKMEKGRNNSKSHDSGIQNDYHYGDLPPPEYSAVMEEAADPTV